MPDIPQTTEYRATQLVYSKKFKLSHAIAPTRANGALHGMRLKMDLIGPKKDQKWVESISGIGVCLCVSVCPSSLQRYSIKAYNLHRVGI